MTDVTLSRFWLNFNDEDYSDSVCLLLPDGQATLIDARYFEWLQGFKWTVMGRIIFYTERTPVTYERRRCGKGRTGYGNFRHGGKTRMVSLHQAVYLRNAKETAGKWQSVGIPAGKHIDHENRVPWDNRSRNLRIATPSENQHNRPKGKIGSSQYKGVSKIKGKTRWVANITLKGKRHYLGSFDDEFKAAQAYNAFVLKHIPDFGYVNPLTIYGSA